MHPDISFFDLRSFCHIFILPLEDIIVRRNYIFLKEELSAGYICPFLYQEGILSDHDLDIACSPNPRCVQLDILLKLLLRHGRSACNKFVNILSASGYGYILHTLKNTKDFKTKEDCSQWQSDITIHHINMEETFLCKTIEAISIADFMLQELLDDKFSLYDHDEIQNQNSKSRRSRALLKKVIKDDPVVLNCFLCAVDCLRHVLPGVSVIEHMKKTNLSKTRGGSEKHVSVLFQDEHLLKVVDVNCEDDDGDHVLIFKFRNQHLRKIQELEKVLVRRIQNNDSKLDELAIRFMHMSIQDGHAGSIVLYLKALTSTAAENLDKNSLKTFIQKILQDSQILGLLPLGTLQLQVETITSGFMEGKQWEVDRSSLVELLADNRTILEDELEPFRFLTRFQQDGIFSEKEVNWIKRLGSRRNRARGFLSLLQGKRKSALEVFVDELKISKETFILEQLFPSTPTAFQCKECQRSTILKNYNEIRDEIDVRILDYTDPPCHSHHTNYKDSRGRYRTPQALLKHVLECDTALDRFSKVSKSITSLTRFTECNCNCPGYKNFTTLTQRKQNVYNFRISTVLRKKETVKTKTPFTSLQPKIVTFNVEELPVHSYTTENRGLHDTKIQEKKTSKRATKKMVKK
ncbi:uncharacterized protein LOC133202527 [Saccostrea echinata]|uniref:uncharacterized protein LOC133202527 n=1 Tax=Saccostrea echinata TaxID=191078 RepID=UPI002A8071C9|nr:uncharacterized protein LOC133202527 [Saccostrea echinata]